MIIIMSPSLEEELRLPEDATLSVPQPCSLRTTLGSVISLSSETSLRASTRCLIVGRQANGADIRIQHGSISRKHAAFYYDANQNLLLQDLGGKHGTHVNGKRIQETTILHDGDSILFGNVRESIFTVIKPPSSGGGAVDAQEETKLKVQEKDVAIDDNLQIEPAQPSSPPPPEIDSGLTGRAKREAEIAAMMASLEEAPTYQKYIPLPEDNNDDENDDRGGKQSAESQNETMRLAQTYKLPIGERLVVSSKSDRRYVITSLAVDPAGSRFCVGGTDTNVRLFDFAGMDQQRTTPFKIIQVEDGHIVIDICYSNTGDRILVATGGFQPKVLDRDGMEIIKFVRGDMYVTDQARTVGHTAALTAVDWHPFHRDVVLTSSLDGSARLWDLNGKTQFQMLVCDKVYQAKNERGQRTAVTAVSFHPGGREFVLGTSCGSIQIWNSTKVGARPDRSLFHAHGTGNAIHDLTYNIDGTRLATRSMGDDTVRVWNPQRLSRSASPIAICTDLPSVHEHSTSAFSPNSEILCAGTSEHYKQGDQHMEVGALKFYLLGKGSDEKDTLPPLLDLPVSKSAGVVIVKWHFRLNQIFLGCSDGSTMVLFDPAMSAKGALLSASKVFRPVDQLAELLKERAPQGSSMVTGEILTPNSLPMYRDPERVTKRKRDKELMDPIKSRRPEPPATGIKTGGQSGASVNFTQFVADATAKTRKKIAGVDPREELFKYQEGKSYTGDDGPVILAEKTVEEEEEEMKGKS